LGLASELRNASRNAAPGVVKSWQPVVAGPSAKKTSGPGVLRRFQTGPETMDPDLPGPAFGRSTTRKPPLKKGRVGTFVTYSAATGRWVGVGFLRPVGPKPTRKGAQLAKSPNRPELNPKPPVP